MPYAKKKRGDGSAKKKWKTKRRTKDLDEIDEDLKDENVTKLLNQEIDVDKPGQAQFYCLHCSRYFIDDQALQHHFKSKRHKQRLKALESEPYSIEDSERAAGFGNFKPNQKRKIETQPQKEPDPDASPSKKIKSSN